MTNSGDPRTTTSRTAQLTAVARIGDEVSALIKVGAMIDPLRAFVGARDDLVLEDTTAGVICRLAGRVTWDITVDQQGTILGYLFHGYDALMAELGVDFAGNPYDRGVN